ncbi:MAG: thioredoxin family protein [Patescibacteria group bacterium]|jgi:thiol-disulfide isomerase/thioredoxin
MRKIIIISVVLIVLIASLVFVFSRKDNSKGDLKEENSLLNQSGENTTNEPVIINEQNNQNATSTGMYVDYDPILLTKADTGKVVLFFQALWEPTCKFLDRNLDSQLANFPNGLVILKLNYDAELELKEKYGVSVEHTLVQVDSQGNEIAKWTGGNDLASIVKNLK